MKTSITSVMRMAILLAIFGIGFLGIVSAPADNDPAWMETLLISKAIGAFAFALGFKLFDRWSKNDKWIKAIDEENRKADEAPNPMRL